MALIVRGRTYENTSAKANTETLHIRLQAVAHEATSVSVEWLRAKGLFPQKVKKKKSCPSNTLCPPNIFGKKPN